MAREVHAVKPTREEVESYLDRARNFYSWSRRKGKFVMVPEPAEEWKRLAETAAFYAVKWGHKRRQWQYFKRTFFESRIQNKA